MKSVFDDERMVAVGMRLPQRTQDGLRWLSQEKRQLIGALVATLIDDAVAAHKREQQRGVEGSGNGAEQA